LHSLRGSGPANADFASSPSAGIGNDIDAQVD
jgi:hypothetical protein